MPYDDFHSTLDDELVLRSISSFYYTYNRDTWLHFTEQTIRESLYIFHPIRASSGRLAYDCAKYINRDSLIVNSVKHNQVPLLYYLVHQQKLFLLHINYDSRYKLFNVFIDSIKKYQT